MATTVAKGDSGLILKIKPINQSGGVAQDIVSANIKLKMKGTASAATVKPMTVSSSEPEYKLSYTFGESDFTTVGTLNCVIVITRSNGSTMTMQKIIPINIVSMEQ